VLCTPAAPSCYHVVLSPSCDLPLTSGSWRRSLCSYTHPALAPEGSDARAAALPHFPNLKELRRHLSERLQLHFCPVCLEGRKVSRSDAWRGMLSRHVSCSCYRALPALTSGHFAVWARQKNELQASITLICVVSGPSHCTLLGLCAWHSAWHNMSICIRKTLAEPDQRKGRLLCLQVFISEQVLYTDKELKQHGRAGDVTGALAESGFSGHPSCRFCRRQFYGDTELFVHMHQTHEQCFLCRRARPDKYVYYRNYAELEGGCQDSSWNQQHGTLPFVT